MKNKINLQKLTFQLFGVISITFIVLSLIFATPYYKTSLWGGDELLNFYSKELQNYNKLFFNTGVGILLFYLYLRIINYKDYFIGTTNFIIITIGSITTLITSFILISRLKPITKFYSEYNYDSINRLKGFSINLFWKNINYFIFWLMIVMSFILIGITLCSFIRFIQIKQKKRCRCNG